MSSRTFSPPRDRLHIEVFMMDQTTSIILDLIAPRQAVVDELFVQNFLLNYHPRRLRHGDRLVALGANHRPVQRFILGQGQIMNAVEDALRDRPNEAMSVDDLERRLEARFAQKLRESEASLEERMMAKINEKDEEHRLATARMLRAADDREYARLSRIRRHRRNLVLFSFVIWLNCELRGPQQPISQTWSRTATDHAAKRELLEALQPPTARLREIRGHPRGRQVFDDENIYMLVSSIAVAEGNDSAHLENDVVLLVSELLVLERFEWFCTRREGLETMALHMIIIMLGEEEFAAIVDSIRRDDGRVHEPVDQSQIARLHSLLAEIDDQS